MISFSRDRRVLRISKPLDGRSGALVGMAAIALGAACRGEDGRSSSPGAGASTATQSPRTTAPVTTASPASATAGPARPAPPSSRTTSPPAPRSAVPAAHEFDAQREVTVRHSSSLRCETKMVREWLRVRCPYTEQTASTGGGDVRVERSTHAAEVRVTHFSRPMEAILPVVPGCSHRLSFGGDWGWRWLRVDWPSGAGQALMYFDQPATSASCRSPADCPSKVCCFNPLAREGFCSETCDVGLTTFTCRSDADCPVLFGTQKTRCVQEDGWGLCR
jgi:hypothetical protein